MSSNCCRRSEDRHLIKPLLIGDQGEAAVIAYHGADATLQEFTSDSDKITLAISKIYPGSDSNRLIDAVAEATRMLRTRPRNRQRIILLVGETRDNSSETRLRSALDGYSDRRTSCSMAWTCRASSRR